MPAPIGVRRRTSASDLDSIVNSETGHAALIDDVDITRVLLNVRENESGWMVDSSQRCLDL